MAHLHGKICCSCAALPFVAAHGMIWVAPGYSFGEAMFGLDAVKGGSGWASGTFAGPTGARQPSTPELGQAEHQVCCFCHLLLMLCLSSSVHFLDSLHKATCFVSSLCRMASWCPCTRRVHALHYIAFTRLGLSHLSDLDSNNRPQG